MGQHFKPWDVDQMFLLPPSLREWLPEGHLAYFVLDLVDQMDLSEIEAYYAKDAQGKFKAASGAPAYDPRMKLRPHKGGGISEFKDRLFGSIFVRSLVSDVSLNYGGCHHVSGCSHKIP